MDIFLVFTVFSVILKINGFIKQSQPPQGLLWGADPLIGLFFRESKCYKEVVIQKIQFTHGHASFALNLQNRPKPIISLLIRLTFEVDMQIT